MVSYEFMNKLITSIFIVAGLGLIWSISGFFSLSGQSRVANSAVSNNSDLNYEQALAAEQTDKCQTPPGYTDEEWLEHMNHHPDRYAECLNQ